MPNIDNPEELAKEVNNSDAAIISGRLITLGRNYYVFNRNYQDITNLFEWVKKPEQILRLWDPQNRNELDTIINEVIRLFHNYLASAKTLVDLTRNVIPEWYKDTDFQNEYTAQISSRFSSSPIVGFIEELRNYNLHYSLPITKATLVMEKNPDTIDFNFVILKRNLLNWKGWTTKGKLYLDLSDDDIDLNKLVESYYQLIFEFHSWLEKRIREIHSKELLWLSEMNQRIINAMDENERQERGLSKK
jgi:hypothetical protein